MTNIKIAAAARRAGLTGLMGAVAAATVIGFAGAAHAAPPAHPHVDPAACLLRQLGDEDCGPASLAMLIGLKKGVKNMPKVLQVVERAAQTDSVIEPGHKVFDITHFGTNLEDLPAVSGTFGVPAEVVKLKSIADMEQALTHGHYLLAPVDPGLLRGGEASGTGHDVVVHRIDAKGVHCLDPSVDKGGDVTVPRDRFLRASSKRHNNFLIDK